MSEDPTSNKSSPDVSSGIAEEPGLPRLMFAHDATLSRVRSQSNPENHGKPGGSVASALTHASPGTNIASTDRGGEAICSSLIPAQVVSPSESSAMQTAITNSSIKDESASGESHVSETSRIGSDQKLESLSVSSVSSTDQNASPPGSGFSDECEDAVVVTPASDDTVSAEKAIVPGQEALLVEVSSDAPDSPDSPEGVAIIHVSCGMGGELRETTDKLSDAEGGASFPESLSGAEKAALFVEKSSGVPSTKDDEALNEMMRNQSVFTAPHFSGSVPHQGIRQFLMNNPDLGGNFPREITAKGARQYQWSDLDFQRARLMVRDTEYCRSKKSDTLKRNADKAFFPLVGVDVFKSKAGKKECVCISQCPDSLACRWLQRKDAPRILVINYILRDMNMVLYYAVPDLDAIEESCQPLLKKLISDDQEKLQDAMKKFKLIPQVISVGSAPEYVKSMMKVPAIVNNKFQTAGHSGKGPDGRNRYTEIYIDIRNGQNMLANMASKALLGSVNQIASSLHVIIGFSIEPFAKDEIVKMGKKSEKTIADHLPEHIWGGVELFHPDISTRELPELQLPPSTVSSR